MTDKPSGRTPPPVSATATAPAPFTMPAPGGLRATLAAVAAIAAASALLPFSPVTAPAVWNVVSSARLTDFYDTMTELPSFSAYVLVMAVIWRLDRPRRAAIVYFAAAMLACGVFTEFAKNVFGRARPETYILRDAANKAKADGVLKKLARLTRPNAVVRDTMSTATATAGAPRADRWLLASAGRPWFSDLFSSFPSGHSVSAFALAAFLCALYPAGRPVWLVMAAGVALARIHSRRHFMEDTLFGGGAGWLLATWTFTWRWPGQLARRLGL